ncbi:hypothetical protein RKD49_007567 [Streptomyces glaucescens]
MPVPPGYAPGEHHFPHDYAPTPDSLARLAALQRPDGGWPVCWAHWAPTTENEARPLVTVEALRILAAWDEADDTPRTS